ncbi:Uncharacterised protein [uncultured archaeon]|nr:Uncharacterised protein [uncultured archaeon]
MDPTDNKRGTVNSVILDAPPVNVNATLNQTADINLNLNGSVWTGGSPQLNLQPVNDLNDSMDGATASNATNNINTALLTLGRSTSGMDIAMMVRATLSGISASDVLSLPITMTVNADWYENRAGSSPDNVFLFKINDTTGEVRDKKHPLSVSQKDTVNNTYTFTFNMEGFSTFALISVRAVAPPSAGGGGGGSGSGGGGVVSSEDFANIENQESHDVNIHTGPIAIPFNVLDIVKEIGFSANTNEGWLTAKVENLRGRPKVATTDAPGTLYKYFNVWVGTSGYGESSKIDSTYTVFKVPDDWLKNNNAESVKLMKFQDGAWKELKTDKVGTETYRADTSGFSSFAIIGVPKAQVEVSPTATVTGIPAPTPSVSEAPTASAPPATLYLILVLMVIIAIAMYFLVLRKGGK